MDIVYILATDVCCYRYDPALRARTQFFNDSRICHTRRSPAERRHYFAEEDRFRIERWKSSDKKMNNYCWYLYIHDLNRAKEPHKTLIEMPTNCYTMFILEKSIKEGFFKLRGERPLVLSFFHNDEDTGNLMYGCPPEQLLEDKASWISMFIKQYPFVKIVEIPYDFTLTEDYMVGLFEQYMLS